MTLARLTTNDLDAIRGAKPLLVRAAEACSIPWQMLAAVWYREAGLREIVNSFQFDPPPDRSVMFGLLQAHCDLSTLQKADVLNGGITQFYSSAVLAACWLCHKCKFDLAVDHVEAAIADAFYGYNGRAFGEDPLNSPYVANELDEHHSQMHFRGTINGKWIEMVDKRPGALTVYRQLLAGAGQPPTLAISPEIQVQAPPIASPAPVDGCA